MSVSYNINSVTNFPKLNNKESKHNITNNHTDSETTTTASLTTDNQSITSTFTQDEYIKRLEDNNILIRDQIEYLLKQDIRDQLQHTPKYF